MSLVLCCGQQLSESRRYTDRQWPRGTRTIRRWRRRSVGFAQVLHECLGGCKDCGAAAEAVFGEAAKACTAVRPGRFAASFSTAVHARVAPMSDDCGDVLFPLIHGRGERRCRAYVLPEDSMRDVRRRLHDDGHLLVTPMERTS